MWANWTGRVNGKLGISQLFYFFIAEAAVDVIVDHTRSLHMGIHNSGPYKFEASLLEVFRERIAYFRGRGYF